MVYLIYLVVAAVIVLLANKASEYVDLIEKKTSLSGAFIGGVMLSAVTSLPELFTSISSTMFLNKPGLCIGNILGSNLFNVAILAILILIFFKSFNNAEISKSHVKVTFAILLIYCTIYLNKLGIVKFDIFTISITSIIIILLYVYGVRNMSSENGGEIAAEGEAEVSGLSIKSITIRFILVSTGIIGLSIIITYITDDIGNRLNLGSGLAGAIFLGVATSLPEVASTISLFRMKNYNIAIGNIIGSNLFNFVILAIADLLYIGKGIYDFSDPKTVNLLYFGLLSAPLMLVVLKIKDKAVRITCSVGVFLCYFAFLIV